MSFTRFWNRSHTLLQPNCLDDIDELTAGKTFSVRYLGRVDVHEDNECSFTNTADAIFKQYKKDKLEKLIRLELFIDIKGVEVRDHFTGERKVLFAIPLSDVREVLHRKKDKAYRNVVIYVARSQPLDPMLKAHVLLCDSPEVTAQVFETFQSAFAHHTSISSLATASPTGDTPSNTVRCIRHAESNNNKIHVRDKKAVTDDRSEETINKDDAVKNFVYNRI